MPNADLLIINAAELVTCAGFSHSPARGADQGRLGIIEAGAVAVADGRILEVGATADLLTRHNLPTDQVLDAHGGVILPGFVDAHTHLVFAGDRSAEWESRMQGKPYLEILREGGGIQSTVEATRAASQDDLLANARKWMRRCLAGGTTTVEIKSGYGLNRDDELKMLEVARQLGAEGPIAVVATYLGAHVVPSDYKDRRSEYLDLVESTAREVAQRNLARFFDVFCEEEAFTLAETERLLGFAQDLGFGLKLHAEQFTAFGAAGLAAQMGATSVDHLERLDDEGLAALKKSVALSSTKGTVAVLLPAVAFHLGLDRNPPARRLIESGVPVALATDLNPGSAFTPSMPMVITLATRRLGLTTAESIMAATINGAHAVGLGAETGSIEPGKRADLIVCDIPHHKWLGYAFGWNPARTVIVGGAVIIPERLPGPGLD